jgi:Mg2+-importing ATPase
MAKAVPPADTFWNRPVQELAAQLNSSAAGLASAEAQARLAQVGANVLAIKRKTTALGLFLRQFKAPSS